MQEPYSPERIRKSSNKLHEHTEKKKFKSESNPHELIRCTQKDKYIWYAAYDEEMLEEKFLALLHCCTDKTEPLVKGLHNFSGDEGRSGGRI